MKKYFLIIFILTFVNAFSQGLSIKGIVEDSTSVPLPDVNVIILGTDLGAATDFNGRFEIKNLNPGNYIVQFSAIGYKTKRIKVTLKNISIVLDVKLSQTVLQSQQVVVTAGKYEQKISDLPVSADIIPSDEFSKKNFSNFEDALRYAPGVNMTSDQISIRGSSGYSRGAGSRVLLALDGLPFYTGDTGETIWEMIPTAVIDHVEIIKGAASSLYGSTAIGGVINVITKDIPEKPSTYFKAFYGLYANPSYSDWKWWNNTRTNNGQTIAHSNRFGSLGIEASFTRLEDLSYRENDYSKKYIGFLKADYTLNSSSSLTFLMNTLNKRRGNFIYWKDSHHALQPPKDNLGQTTATNRYLFGLIYKNVFSNKFFMNIKTSYYRNNWKENAEPVNESKSNFYRTEIQTNLSLNNDLIIVSGVEGIYSNVKSNLFGNPEMNGAGIYSQADYKLKIPLTISAGLRFDYNKIDTLKSSSAVSPKVGLNYKLSNELSLRSSFGTGFRAPSLAEAFTSTTSNGITVKPNPNLKSEKNFTTEFGADYQPYQDFIFDAAIFWNEYYDFIEPSVDPTDGLVVFGNVTRARIQGFELNSTLDLFSKSIKLSMHYTYLWARDIQKHKALKYRPRNILYASLDYFISDFNFGIDFRYWSRVEQIDEELINLGLIPDGNLRVPVYVADFRASYNFALFNIPVKLYFNADNIFNYNYVELIANLEPIRNFSLSTEFYF